MLLYCSRHNSRLLNLPHFAASKSFSKPSGESLSSVSNPKACFQAEALFEIRSTNAKHLQSASVISLAPAHFSLELPLAFGMPQASVRLSKQQDSCCQPSNRFLKTNKFYQALSLVFTPSFLKEVPQY